MNQRAQRRKVGSVRFDKRRKTWNYLWYENGKRRSQRIGTKQEYPNKGAAWSAAEVFVSKNQLQTKTGDGRTVREIIGEYRKEKMPKRIDTRRAYEVWLNHYVLPRWG